MGLRRKDTPIRIGRQRKDSRLSRDQVMAAYDLYYAGMSVPSIARKIWKKFGFASVNACVNSIYYSFSSYKLRVRNSGEAKWIGARCKGCGCDRDEFDSSCRHCRDRKRWREKREERRAAELIATRKKNKLCTACGVTLSEKTIGCEACRDRHSKRARRAA